MTSAFGRDLATSYAASIARVASWLIVSAVVYRAGGPDQLALLMLIRGTVGLLSYAGLGLTPALIHKLTRPLAVLASDAPAKSHIIDYASPDLERSPLQSDTLFTTALALTLIMVLVGGALSLLYTLNIGWIHTLGRQTADIARNVAMLIATGVLLRTLGDVFGAKLQAEQLLWVDNLCLVVAEAVFVVVACAAQTHYATGAAGGFFVGSLAGLIARGVCNARLGAVTPRRIDLRLVLPLLGSGALVLVSQLADWFYAPLNYVLIQACLSLKTVAVYSLAVQVDAALQLLTAGLTSILLPRSAAAAVAGDRPALRRYFIRGALFSLALLSAASVCTWLISGRLFQLWFHDPLPATQAILPLVLIHTTLGSIGGVGRSVLFGMGRIKPYAIAAIIGGVANAGLAIVFLNWTVWGLKGVVLATVISVAIRCGIWTPWYTLRAIDRLGQPHL
jgi:O-antigen/teichoic acid export membrane protein